MLLTFYLTFNVIGQRLSDWMDVGIDALTALADRALTAYGINPVVHSLIIDGIFRRCGKGTGVPPHHRHPSSSSCPFWRTPAIWPVWPL